MDRTTQVTFAGCILKPTVRGQFRLQHSARATLETEVDAKGLEFLLHFSEPCSLGEAILHFRSIGWDLPDADYEAAFEQMIAGCLLAPATQELAAASEARSEAPSDLVLAEAGSADVEGVIALRNQLFTNVERTLLPEDAPAPVRGELLARVPALSIEARALLCVLLGRAFAEARERLETSSPERAFAAFFESFVPFATVLEELRERGFVTADGQATLAVAREERFPIFELLREELQVRERRKEWRLKSAQAEALHLVARRGGAIVGYLRGLLLSYDKVCEEAVLQELVVSTDERGQGTGSRLVSELQRICTEKGVAVARVPTQRANGGAIRFYERAGFKLVKEDVYLSWCPRDEKR